MAVEIEKSKLYEFTKYFAKAALTKLNKLDGKPEVSKAFKICGGLGGAGLAAALAFGITSLVSSTVEEAASYCGKIKQKKDKIQLIQIINSNSSSQDFQKDFLQCFIRLGVSVYNSYKNSIAYVNLQSYRGGEGVTTGGTPSVPKMEFKTQAMHALGEYAGELAFNQLLRLGTQSHDQIISSFTDKSIIREMEAKWDSITTSKLYYWVARKDRGQVKEKTVTPYAFFVEKTLENLLELNIPCGNSLRKANFFNVKNTFSNRQKIPIRTMHGEKADSVDESLCCGTLNLNYASDAIYDLIVRDPSFSWTISVSEDIKDASSGVHLLNQGIKSLQEKTDEHNENLAELKKITEEIPAKLVSSFMSDYNKKKQPKKIKNVWFHVEAPIRTFTGREKFLTQLHEKIQGKQNHQNGATTIVAHSPIDVIAATGGIGKTETARMYIQKHGTDFDHVVWIDAEEKSVAQASFELLAQKLKIKNDGGSTSADFGLLLEKIYIKLLTNATLLLILDNAETLDDDLENCTHGIRPYLPKSLHPSLNQPSILITSRNRRWEDFDVTELPSWTLDESTTFVLSRLKLEKIAENEKAALHMCQFFGGLPIAVQSAVMVILEQSELQEAIGDEPYEIRDFIKDYENLRGKQKVLRSKPSSSCVTQQNLMTLWNVTFDKIRRRENGPAALKILSTMANLSPTAIPMSLISALFEKEFDKIILGRALILLANYCLITKFKNFYTVHRMIQAVAIEHSNSQIIKTPLWSTISTYVISFFVCPGSVFLDSTFSKENRALIKLFMQINKFSKDKHSDYQEVAETKDIVASMWHVLNNLSQKISRSAFSLNMKYILFLVYDRQIHARAEEKLSYIISNLDREMGLHGITALDLKGNIAQLYVDNMRFELGKRIYGEVLKVQTQALGVDHSETLSTQNLINLAEKFQKEFEEALKMYAWVLKCWEVMHLQQSEDALEVKSHVAHLLLARGDYPDALKLFDQILDNQTMVMGPEHASTLKTQCNILEVLTQQGEHQVAREMYATVTEKIEMVLGPRHSSTLQAQFNHAYNLSASCQYEKALVVYENIFKIEKRLLGFSHRKTLSTLGRIGYMFITLGRQEKALWSYVKVLRAREVELRMSADERPFTLTNKTNLTTVELLQCKDNISLKMLKKLFKKQNVLLGSDHQDTMLTKFQIGQVYFLKRDYNASARIAQTLLSLELKSAWEENSDLDSQYVSSCRELLKRSVDMLPEPLPLNSEPGNSHLTCYDVHQNIISTYYDHDHTNDLGVVPSQYTFLYRFFFNLLSVSFLLYVFLKLLL